MGRSRRDIDYAKMDALIKQGTLTAREIAERIGVVPETVRRRRVRLGLGQPFLLPLLPPLKARLAQAERMLDEGLPFSEIMRTLHFSRVTLHRYFPGRQWNRKQINAHALAVRYANDKIQEVWTVDNSVSLTLPPYQRQDKI